MQIAEQEVERIIDGVWVSTLGMDWHRIQERHIAIEPSLTGVIQITGAWQGAITIRCGPGLANAITEAMFGAEPGASSPQEVRDALGEVANMIAGNLKALLPSGCQLSLPTVVEGREYQLAVPRSVTLLELVAVSRDQPFHVGVLVSGGDHES